MQRRNIKLLLGPYRSGKTDRILASVLDQLKIRRPCEALIVVPSERYKALLERRLFKLATTSASSRADAGRGTVGIFGLRLLTFYQFCQSMLNCCQRFPRLLPDSLRRYLIEQILQDASLNQNWNPLSKSINNASMAKAVLELIDELQRSAYSPEFVMETLSRANSNDTARLTYAHVYKRYCELLDRIDYLDKHGLAYLLLEELSVRDNLAGAPQIIAFDGFDRFNLLQLRIIEKTAELVPQLLVSFDYLRPEDDEHGEYEWKRHTYKQLVDSLAARLLIEPLPTEVKKQHSIVSISSSGDRFLEMAQVAAFVKTAMVKRSVKSEEILVVTRRITDYTIAAQAAFEEAGLSCFIDDPVNLCALPIAKFVLNLFSLPVERFARERVMTCLRSQFFKRTEFELTTQDLGRLDLLSSTCKVLNTKEQWLEALEHEPNNLQHRLRSFIELMESAPEHGSAYGFVSWLEDTLDRLLVMPNSESAIEEEQLWQTRAALAAMRKCFAELLVEENVLGDLGAPVDRDYSAHLDKLASLIEKANFPSQPSTKQSVLICGAEMAPNRSFDEVYIVGLVEGEFPARLSRSGLLTAEEVEKWASLGIDLHNPRFEPGFEVAMLSALKQRARRRVYLSTPRFDMEGEELTPSFYMAEQSEIAGPLQVLDYFQEQKPMPVSARNAVISALWSPDQAESISGIIANSHPLIQDFWQNVSEARISAIRRAGYNHDDDYTRENEYNGFLREYTESGALQIALPQFFSASQLGRYGKCPHQYWLTNCLKVEPIEEPEEGLDPKSRGQAYHRALELFYQKLIAADKAIDDLDAEEVDRLSDRAVATAVTLIESDPHFRAGEFWVYEKQELAFRVRQFLRFEHKAALTSVDKYRPFQAEASFGYEGGAPPLKITDAALTILMRGKIDRIDQALEPTAAVGQSQSAESKRFRVIDYKTGSDYLGKSMEQGIELQLPIYALAVQRSISPDSKVTAGQYLSVHGLKATGNLFSKRRRDGEQPPDLIALTEEKASAYARAIKQGIFTVQPVSRSICAKCQHEQICRIQELAEEVSANGDVD
jgi:ATP-dependent helicase/nuclease subunit B